MYCQPGPWEGPLGTERGQGEDTFTRTWLEPQWHWLLKGCEQLPTHILLPRLSAGRLKTFHQVRASYECILLRPQHTHCSLLTHRTMLSNPTARQDIWAWASPHLTPVPTGSRQNLSEPVSVGIVHRVCCMHCRDPSSTRCQVTRVPPGRPW